MTDLLRVIADESDRFLRAIWRTDAAPAAASCPELGADDLLRNLTLLHVWARVLGHAMKTP